jgi:hypothetical protein
MSEAKQVKLNFYSTLSLRFEMADGKTKHPETNGSNHCPDFSSFYLPVDVILMYYRFSKYKKFATYPKD